MKHNFLALKAALLSMPHTTPQPLAGNSAMEECMKTLDFTRQGSTFAVFSTPVF